MRKVIYLVIIVSVFKFSYSEAQKKIVKHIGEKNAIVYSIAIFNQGNSLVIPNQSTLEIYDVVSGQLKYKLSDPSSDLIVSVEATDNYIVSGAKNGNVTLWDIGQRKVIKSFQQHSGTVTAVDISSDESHFVSGGEDKKVVLYQLSNSEVTASKIAHNGTVQDIEFSPTDNFLASAGSDRKINLWDYSLNNKFSKSDLADWPRDLTFNSDGTQLIHASDDSRIYYWEVSSDYKLLPRNNVKHGMDRILSVQYSDQHEASVAGGMDGTVRIRHTYGLYKHRINYPITKVIFKPPVDDFIRVFASTLGRGVIFIEAVDMTIE